MVGKMQAPAGHATERVGSIFLKRCSSYLLPVKEVPLFSLSAKRSQFGVGFGHGLLVFRRALVVRSSIDGLTQR